MRLRLYSTWELGCWYKLVAVVDQCVPHVIHVFLVELDHSFSLRNITEALRRALEPKEQWRLHGEEVQRAETLELWGSCQHVVVSWCQETSCIVSIQNELTTCDTHIPCWKAGSCPDFSTGRQWMMAQVLGPVSSIWDTWGGKWWLLDPGFSPALAQSL